MGSPRRVDAVNSKIILVVFEAIDQSPQKDKAALNAKRYTHKTKTSQVNAKK